MFACLLPTCSVTKTEEVVKHQTSDSANYQTITMAEDVRAEEAPDSYLANCHTENSPYEHCRRLLWISRSNRDVLPFRHM